MAVTAASDAAAEPHRLALVGAAPSLKRSIDIALDPWDVQVLVLEEESPDAGAPDVVERAEAIARAHGVDAVAWVQRSEDEITLWLVDVGRHAVQRRTLRTAAMVDSAIDASTALSLKTLLRATVWRAAESPPPAAAPEEAHPAHRIEAALAVRSPIRGATAEPRVEIGWATWIDAFGAGVGVSLGPGVTFATADARGTRVDFALRGSVRARLAFTDRIACEPRAGASLHVEETRTELASGAPTDPQTRVSPSIDGALFLVWTPRSRFELAVGAEVLYSLRYQRWLAGDRIVFAPSPLAMQGSAALAWSF